MNLKRRTFLATCASLPVLGALAAGPLIAQPATPAVSVGEIWGLPYWASGALPVVAATRKPASAPPTWHPEFT